MENDKCIVKQILPTLISFIKNPFEKYNIKEHASITGAISNLTGKNVNYSFVKNNEGNIFLREIYKTVLKYMRYFDDDIDETIVTLNFIFAFPIKNKIIDDFCICRKIYIERYVLFQKYMLLHCIIFEDVANTIIIKMFQIQKIENLI